MAESDKTPNDDAKAYAEAIRAQLEKVNESAQKALESIAKAAAEATDNAAKAQDARSKADAEALHAAKAKEHTEGHFTFISQKRGEVEAHLAAIAAQKKAAEDQAQAITALKTAADTDRAAVAEVRKTADTANEPIRTALADAKARAAEIIKALATVTEHAAQVKKLLDDTTAIKASTETTQKATEAARDAALAAKTATEKTRDAAALTLGEADKSKAAVAQALKDSQGNLDSIKDIVQKATETNTKVLAYEANLSELEKKYDALRAQVEGLLPGAASAGLAFAFKSQKARFTAAQTRWQTIFTRSMIALICVAIVSAVMFYLSGSADDTWSTFGRRLAERVPLVAPLVWLAIYSGRHYMLALRLEEEYSFKEALSVAFEGYKREMLDLSKLKLPEGHVPPAILFSEKVLAALTEQPGRIYNSKQKDITPANSAIESLEGLAQHKELLTDALSEAFKKSVGSLGDAIPRAPSAVAGASRAAQAAPPVA
jgi:hypothetical protein